MSGETENLPGIPVAKSGFDPTRRRFLSAVAAAAGVTLAPGVMLYAITKTSPAAARPLAAAA